MTTKGAKLVLLWTGASVISAPVLYVLVPGLLTLLRDTGPMRERLYHLASGAIYEGYFGMFFGAVAAVPCAIVFGLWASLSRRFHSMERSKLHVAGFTGLLAFPTAAIVALAISEFMGRIDWVGALEAFPLVLSMIWVAILWPRLACRCLAPGVFTAV